MDHKYGTFSKDQISQMKQKLRRQIFFLLLVVDPNTKEEYENVDVEKTFKNLLYKIGGLNSLLNEPPELVDILSLLEKALLLFNEENINFSIYRKLILEAGDTVLQIKEV